MNEHVVDMAVLQAWMDAEGVGSGPIENVTPLSGGTQNIMLRFDRGGQGYILRRGPEHLRKHTNRAMRREMQVLGALGGTDVPHARLLAACPDEEVLGGASFYLMQPVDGYNASVELSEPARTDGDHRYAMGMAMADALARLGSVDHVAVGLGDVGNPDGFLERQIPRWLEEIERYSALEGYPGFALEGLDDIVAWLKEHGPASWTPGLMHGDYHVANVMFAPDEPRIAAIVDWEMCTVGDPLLDLGWLQASWPGEYDSLNEIGGALGEAGGLPSTDELVARYAEVSGRDVSYATWYRVLACFKLGIVLEGSYARWHAGQASEETGTRLHKHGIALFAQALDLMG